jgi:hypothetical protein
MRLKALFNIGLAVLSAGITIGMAAAPAAAFDLDKVSPPPGWGTDRTVRHWVYYPRYHNLYHVHAGTDPYAYRSARRGYYPYGGSAYWRAPQHARRAHLGTPPAYHPAWGRHGQPNGPGTHSGQHHIAPWHW